MSTHQSSLSELEEHQDRFHQLLNAIEDYSIYMTDPAGTVVLWNRGAEAHKGYTPEEILGRSFETFFDPEDRNAGVPAEILRQALSTGSARGEGWRVARNGERFWVKYSVAPVRDRQGVLKGLAHVSQDRSESKRHLEDLFRMESALRSERDRLFAATESSLDALFIAESLRDESGEIIDFVFTYLNSKVEGLVRLKRSFLIGKRMCEALPINRTLGLYELYRNVVETGEPLQLELPINDRDVKSDWLQVNAVKLGDGIAITGRDITERKLRELQLAQGAAYTRSILASSPYATIATDLQGRITSINPAAERMLWFGPEELIGLETPLVFLDQGEVAARAAALSEEFRVYFAPGWTTLIARLERGYVDDAEWKLVRRDGSRFDAQITMSHLRGPDEEAVGYILIATDITERKRAQEYISHLAHHDALTGLPTRILLNDRLDVSLARARRYGHKVSLIMLDLDHFKRVNDLQGHHSGDELLKIVANRLRACIRASDTVARMGGDEFVILLDHIVELADAEQVAAKILRELTSPAIVGGQLITPTASMGICTFPDNAVSAEGMMRNADIAMYQAKTNGRNGYKAFDQRLEAITLRHRTVGSNLGQALALNELELVYQPQISLITGKVSGVEALLRWNSAALGLVMPDDFIPVAEENGMILPIGAWVLHTACGQGRSLQQELGRELTIAVNVSPLQFYQSSLHLIVREALENAGLSAGSLELEITENILVGDSPEPLAMLEKIRETGVRVAIDDFGTGFSSMSYVLRFRVDRLKIDQSFVREMTSNRDNLAVTAALIAMSRSLRIPVIAEGVETRTHRDLLIAEGCDEAQGYLYSKPVPFSQLAETILEIERQETETARQARPLDGQRFLGHAGESHIG